MNHNNNAKDNLFVGERGPHTAFHMENISEINKGEKHPMFGKHHSEETKKKIGIGNKGKIVSDETKRKLSEINKGKKHSEETKKKMSESSKGEKHSMFGKHHSEETKKKMSKAIEMFYLDTNEFIQEFVSGVEAQEITGINQGNISFCCLRKRNYAGEYNNKRVTWKFAN